ncbi:MAG: PAS domain S-box protein [Bacteroidales bacterium]|nr:PAS domain S-box protein [Bacteroidales bacterium]MBN2762807.1 PAS domain S-box protein [Bacteroidales bacterium]
MSNSWVSAILQDQSGFMWFGTWNGLNRFNGYDFQVFKPVLGDTLSISNNVIQSLCEDHSGNLWVGTENGLNWYDPNSDKFIRFYGHSHDSVGLSNSNILSMLCDHDGTLWIGTKGGGLNSVDSTTVFRRFLNPFSPESNHVNCIIEDKQNNSTLWIGTEQGLFRFDKITGDFIHNPIGESDLNHVILSLYQDEKYDLYIGTWGYGLIKFDREENRFIYCFEDARPGIRGYKHTIVFSILPDLYGHLWLGTRDQGLMQLNTKTLSLQDFTPVLGKEFIHDQVITSLYRGSSGIIWVGTRYDGIHKIVPGTKNFVQPTDESIDVKYGVITAVLLDDEGNKWFGTRNNGLTRVDEKTGHVIHFRQSENSATSLSSNNILSVCPAKEGKKSVFWIGTDGGGLNKFDPVTGKSKHYKNDPADETSLSNDHIYALLNYDNDHLLVGSWGIPSSGGLDLFNKKTESFINFNCDPDNPVALSSRTILCLYRDKDGVIWIGTKGGGLNRMTVKNINATIPEEIADFKSYRKEAGRANTLSHNDVFCIFEDKNGVLWVGTGGGGLNRFDRVHETFRSFSQDDGFIDDMIYNILEDSYNNLWLSTSNGIIKFNTKTEAVKNYSKSDGLQHNVFSPGAAFRSPSGELYFGGVNGYTSFYPDSIRDNLNTPAIVITSFRISGRGKTHNARDYTRTSLNYLKKIILPHYLNSIAFEFASLDYTLPEKNKYKYRLTGYHEDWSYVNADRRYVSYDNLPSGRYIFTVKGSNNDLVWNEEGRSIEVIISPPFYKSNIFRIFMLIFVLGALSFLVFYIVTRYQHEKLRVEEEMKESILDERNQLRTLIDNMPDMIYIKDRESRFIVANKKVASVMGATPEEVINKTDFDYYTHDLASQFYDDEQSIMKSLEPKINYEEPGLDEQGNRVIISTTKVPLINKDGEVVGIVGIGRDITKAKRIEIQLRKRTEDLQETNRLLEERQEEIQQQAEELAAQAENLRHINDELERLNRTKDKFFSIIAHDLRNPFHAIIGFSELLTKEYNSMNDQQKIGLLELINVSSEGAFNLLENLLQWARTQTDKIKFSPDNIDINEIVASTINFLSITAEKKHIKLKNMLEPKSMVFADKNMITTVIRNLISNAVKFTKNGGEVRISSTDKGDMTEIHITDTGIGMNKETLGMLFRIDTYHSTTGTAGETGTGLGLIVSKEFVEKHGGNIKVKSEEKKGSTFSFSLPKESNQ